MIQVKRHEIFDKDIVVKNEYYNITINESEIDELILKLYGVL
jgi:hypothetical protein